MINYHSIQKFKRLSFVQISQHLYIPSICDGDNSSPVLSNVLEDGLGEIEVVVGRVAAAARRAEVCGGDHDGAGEAPLGIVNAPQLKASAAAQPVVEQRRAQRRSVGPVPLAIQIPVPTSPSYKHPKQKKTKKKQLYKIF